ncbi:MATE family efflux transporter [Neomicrococcus aestuarii]|uniref:MATE family efflux transporter n=1 Tax=Neomicrococcus aestuarii TaxID=556325 RepID=A0A1L2ZPF4_9MICC|nr:MATE family efflux transporter [Neomicrococcus aestuarii]APF41060.1 MATE family efflux transporter [Neomicrococcus aestuarii]MBB5512886.1 putative MATE family efflux protein [Neomicrococcus aestuarii]
MTQHRGIGRKILALAIPALGALIAEPLFLMADTAIVGHLGVSELAGAGLGTAVVHTTVGLMIFLAYSTTPAVARHFGAHRLHQAYAAGRDGVWLALIVGAILGVVLWIAAPWLVSLMGGHDDVARFAIDYIRWSMPGLPAMLLVLAATGVLRGLQDTKTPLYVAAVGFGTNIGLNVLFVYGLGMSVAGSALGTSVTQWGMALAYLWMLIPRAQEHSVNLAPTWSGVLGMAHVGGWLMLRTLTLRVGILATVFVATGQGAATLAAHQVIFTLFTFMAFALDALAIAAQALIGKELGAGDVGEVRSLTRVMTRWGIYFGLFTGLVLAIAAPFAGRLFTSDPDVQALITVGVWVLAASQPLCGVVFVLDGVLIGAGDARYLALAGVIALAVYAPLLWLTTLAAPGAGAIIAIWLAFAVGYMAARAATLWLRARTDVWMKI